MIDRRAFLRAGIGATGALLTSTFQSPAKAQAQKHRILIIGAGLSGLAAGYRLQKLGYDVRIFEARERPGGRVLTLRDFPGGQYADAGAARIFHDHKLTSEYIEEFGLQVAPFYPDSGKFVRFRNDRAETVGWDKFAEATEPVMVLEKRDRWRRIVGGTDRLPLAIAEKLASRISYNSPVRTIASTNGEVTVRLQNGTFVSADLVVGAVPLPLLKLIEFTPKFPDVKQQLIDNTKYDAASRVFFETRDRFWIKQNLNGFGFGDRLNEIWESSLGQRGPGGIVQSYFREPFASELSQMGEPERIALVAGGMERLFPGLRSNTVSARSKCWSLDPWTRGAWAHLLPEQKKIISKPEGRIFFAGEHLSDFPSWMQGALQSAHHVVGQIAVAPVAAPL